MVRIDNKLEFASEQFNELCKIEGIRTAYTFQQNGRAEVCYWELVFLSSSREKLQSLSSI